MDSVSFFLQKLLNLVMTGLYLKMSQFHFLGNNLTGIENSRWIQLSQHFENIISYFLDCITLCKFVASVISFLCKLYLFSLAAFKFFSCV